MLNVWNSNQVFFVIRHKHNICFESIKENDLPEQRHQLILKDELIKLTGTQSKKKYPKRLRRVAIWDEENQQIIELITNQMSWTANTISELYKSRSQIEICFREIKQLLHIKSFIGTTQNAVMIQIWTALITILILKFLKELAKYAWQLSNLVAFLRLNLFVKIDLQRWLDRPFDQPANRLKKQIQGVFFNKINY
ncbi:MAG: transposase [Cyclobacteriaceae bacterium]|nr:transposase [Cyclobacteriaceae bacterium]